MGGSVADLFGWILLFYVLWDIWRHTLASIAPSKKLFEYWKGSLI